MLGGLLDSNVAKYSGACNFGPTPNDHLTVKELAELAIKTWGKGEWTDASNTAHVHEASLLKLDISKAKDVLNWKTKLNEAKAIELTIEWYRQPITTIYDSTIGQTNTLIAL